MSGKLFGYARVSVASDADANNLETQHRVLADCEQVFENVGSGTSWNRPDRALLQSEAFAGYRQRRVVVEHRLALLVQLGIHQARYFGRIKTRFQLYCRHGGQPDRGGRQSRHDRRNRHQCRQRPDR